MEHAKIDRRKARWFFVSSMMTTVDDLKTTGRASSLPLFDFIEAICKVAECVKTKGAHQDGLPDHFEAMMAYLGQKLQDIWGGTDEETVAQNMQRVGGMNKQAKKKKSAGSQHTEVTSMSGDD